MKQIFSNNANATVGTQLLAGGLTLVLGAGEGAQFASPAANEYQAVTLIRSDTDFEIVYLTARTNDTLTIIRAQEGTSASQWEVGEVVSARVTQITMERLYLLDQVEIKSYGETVFSQIHTSAANTIDLDIRNGNIQYVELQANADLISFNTTDMVAGRAYHLTLEIEVLTGLSYSLTWPTGLIWPAGTPGVITGSVPSFDVFQLYTTDAGTTWKAFTSGLALA